MKQIIYLFCFSLGLNTYSQQKSAVVKAVDGIVINKYLKNNLGFYCEMETQFLYNRDTLLFFQSSNKNVSILEDNRDLEKIIGKSDCFYSDYLYESANGLYKHELTISKYNYHNKNTGTVIVDSPSFFTKGNDDYLYSVYQFSGSVVFYSGLTPYKDSSNLINCFCPQIESSKTIFAVLKEVTDLKPLTNEQVIEMKFTRSGIRSIKVFYCE